MLHVSLLGEQSVTDDGTGVRARSSRTVALIGFLVTHAGSPQPRQRIAGLFWPDSADAQALTNLRRELHQLRLVLGDEPSLIVTSRDLCWCDTQTCHVDVRTFDIEGEAARAAAAAADDDGVLLHATRALAEYRGDLLPGVYEDWVLEARSQRERQCVELCDLVCAARARRGDLAGAVEAARRRIQLQPLEEAGYRTLMQLQADLGDRAGAVSTYHHCASVLERELAITPDPATRQAFERLMARSGPDPAGTGLPQIGPAIARSGIAAARMVGRSREFSVLEELWRGAVAGQPGLVVVRGGAGVGKTRLVTEVARLARRQGAVVAGSQCFGTAGRLALAPVADWLRNREVQAARATLEEAWRTEVDRLVPAAGRGERGAGPRAMVDAWQRLRFFEGLARALLAVDRPMLLVLDNMQWCDEETLAFLTFCLGLAPGAQLLVAATLRNDSPREDPVLADWTDRMRATGVLTELDLSPFEAADTARLAEAIAGQPLPEADVLLLQGTTGGFPLYVVEAVRATADHGGASRPPGDLTAVLRNRLEQATVAAREVAGLAAAVGTDFTLDLVTEASDLDADIVVGAVDELWRRRILREFRDGYDFSHDLLRDTAYEQVSPPKRWLLHRRIAQSLELLHADDTDAVSAQLAEQYARGGRPGRAVAYYQRAANVAAGMFAHAEAIRLGKEALSIVRGLPDGRDRDRQELAVLEAMAAPLNARYGYSSPDLQEALERSIDLAESLGRRDSTAHRPGRAVDVAIRPGPHRRRLPGGRPRAGPGRSRLRAERPGSLRRRRVGPQPRQARGGAASPRARRPDVQWCRVAERRHPARRARHGLGRARSLAAGPRPGRSRPAQRAPSRWRARSTTRTAWPWPWPTAASPTRCAVTCPEAEGRPSASCASCASRYGFAYYREWALILDGWSRGGRAGHRPGPARHRQPRVGGLLRPHAVLAVAARRPVGPQ